MQLHINLDILGFCADATVIRILIEYGLDVNGTAMARSARLAAHLGFHVPEVRQYRYF